MISAASSDEWAQPLLARIEVPLAQAASGLQKGDIDAVEVVDRQED